MIKFRKNKSESISRTESIKTNFINIPQKDAIAIVPPKRVIKALYDYNAPSDPPHYLSFSQGDFLHVVAREKDEDWYEACNPLQGTRGLVPVKYFETVGKTTRDSRGSEQSAPHDSGYAESSKSPNGIPLGHRMSKSIGKMSGAMVYGIVAFDFHAERPDELDAKEGEAIIVIAQSNPEWFVAKPITRLGGPGLIPVSFIEIKDMQTGKTVTDPSEAIAKAGIPRVEEWKKMAADYKNTSIPLGSFAPPGGATHSPSASVSGISSGMNRMSIGAPTNGHARSPSNFAQSPAGTPQAGGAVSPVKAGVPRFLYADEKFHFIVECSMANGSHWDLSRIYEDFYELQINLIKAFPEEAGQTGQQRILPFMPGPVQFVTDKISEGRRENLDEYLHHLLRLGPHISRSALVCGFFTPRPGDYEVDPSEMDSNHAQSAIGMGQPKRFSQNSTRSANPYSPQAGYAPQHQRQLSSAQGPRSTPGHYRNPSDYSQTSAPMQRQMTQASASSISSNPAPITPLMTPGMTPAMTPAMTPGLGGAAFKIKVWFDRDTCVVVRMPAKGAFRFTDMYRKVAERRRLEYVGKKDSGQEDNGGPDGAGDDPPLEIEYRDERDGEYYKLSNDDELAAALETNEKLTLVVREIGT
ncbi:scaffold protein Scd2 [Myriangium duriaei CBS 260.36]|uniref:Scaffold protein Scd2 n=1 Tax=Myriangium duriaei CBS 260.36 TaxID=1168546 RepID=A0A9P4MJH7_9PEZI|nr:scaffold protein Scd2 [Myriangium duriaei CBS 260.36]